jgi:outer membrane murein-binding lipoprotein Lpp
MKGKVSLVFVAAVAIVAASVFTGCASGPKFEQPSTLQQVLNEVAKQFPIEIAGKQVQISFEGPVWRGKADGEDLLAGDCQIDENADGATITLNQTWMYVDTGKVVAGKKVGKWQETPGPEFVLEYKKGPPESFALKE